MKLGRRDFCFGMGALACLPGCKEPLPSTISGGDDPPEDLSLTIFGKGKARVVEVRWAQAVDSEGKVDAKCIEQMIARALERLWVNNPWAQLAGGERRIGIKTNCITSQSYTHPEVAGSVAKGLVQAGSKPEHVTVWDRDTFALEGRGYKIDKTGKALGYRCLGSESAEGGKNVSAIIAGNKIYFSKLLTSSDLLINIAALKDHSMAGVTLSLKNNFGMISGAERLHGNIKGGSGCEPAISELAAHSEIKGRLQLAMIDALIGVGQGGPGPTEAEHVFRYGGILLSEDPVALDRRGLSIIESWRKRQGLVPIGKRTSPNPSPPLHIDNAAGKGVSP